jgi:hypothetical protein
MEGILTKKGAVTVRRVIIGLAASMLGQVTTVHAQVRPTTVTGGGAGQDTGTLFRSPTGGSYQASEVVTFEGRIGNNASNGDHEGGLLFANGSSFSYNPGGSAFQHPWHTGNDSAGLGDSAVPRTYNFNVSYQPATGTLGASMTASMWSQLPGGSADQMSYTYTWSPTVATTRSLDDLLIRLAPANAGNTGTWVSLNNLALTIGNGSAQNLINPSTGDSSFTGRSDATQSFAPRYFYHFDDVLDPTRSFNLTGQAQLAWSPELRGGTSPINGSRLAFEIKFGDFVAIQVPEPATKVGLAFISSLTLWTLWRRHQRNVSHSAN